MNALPQINEARYARLLANTLPRPNPHRDGKPADDGVAFETR